ncbi:thioredoxin H9-like [Punica granatum]|nr:thioredoxin H9-like [Punica granatum]
MGSCLPKYQQAGRSDPNVNLTGGNLHLVTTMEIWEEKLSEAEKCRKSVIANFSATWCGPCRTISAFYAELAQKHPSLMFLLVDVDQLTELSTLWDIQATPTFFLLRNGQQIDKHVGANKQDLQRKITAILNSKP